MKKKSLFSNIEIGKEYSFDITVPHPEKENIILFKGMIHGKVLEKHTVGGSNFCILDGERGVNMDYVDQLVG